MKMHPGSPLTETMEKLSKVQLSNWVTQGMWSIALALETVLWDDPNPQRHSEVLFPSCKSIFLREAQGYLANHGSYVAF